MRVKPFWQALRIAKKLPGATCVSRVRVADTAASLGLQSLDFDFSDFNSAESTPPGKPDAAK